jgi:hypothetical protein
MLILEVHPSDATPKGIEMSLEGEPLFCRLFLSADQEPIISNRPLSRVPLSRV